MAEMTHGNAVMKKNRQGYGYNYTDLGATYNYINNELKMEAHPVLEMWQEPLETQLGLMFGFAKTKYRNKGEKDWSEPEAPIPIIVGVEQERVGNDGNRKKPQPVMQRLGSAITYAVRYSIRTAFGLADTDDDGQLTGFSLDVPKVSDDNRKRVDTILDAYGYVDEESASNFIRTVLGNPRLSLTRLTDAQARQFIGVVEQRNRQQNRNVPSNVQEGRK